MLCNAQSDSLKKNTCLKDGHTTKSPKHQNNHWKMSVIWICCWIYNEYGWFCCFSTGNLPSYWIMVVTGGQKKDNICWRPKFLVERRKICFPAAAAAKSLQSCLTLCDPIDGSPLGSSVPGILQARILEWVAISFSNTWKWKVKVKLLSRAWLLVTPWTAAYQAPPPMGFSRHEYWSGLPLPSPRRQFKVGRTASLFPVF